MGEMWKGDGMSKVKFFCWMLEHNKVLTYENLKKRGIDGPSKCPLYHMEEETISHLFIECLITLEV